MKKITTLFYTLLVSVALQAQTDSLLVARLDSLTLDPMFQTSQLGLMVWDLSADTLLYECNAHQAMRPASTMKLVTAITALDRLGPDHRFRTSLYYEGAILDSTLVGDVYCVGGMDPAFSADDMRAFSESLRALGVDSIRGRIIADVSMKNRDLLGEGWCWDDDNPVLTPLLVDRKDEFLIQFVSRLRLDNVVVEAPFSEGRLPDGARLICSRAHTLSELLERMMKESDNLYAESVLYHIALAQSGRPATAKGAWPAIRQVIQRAGYTFGNYRLADGSGLSLYNYVTPHLLVSLLRYAWQSPKLFEQLCRVLPVAGVDGTLKERMQHTSAEGNARAKTGTLTGVSSLAGYVMASTGHRLCFCIINQGALRNRDARAFQDRVVLALCTP